jgi:GNAT superfamily N-acetyltransferase
MQRNQSSETGRGREVHDLALEQIEELALLRWHAATSRSADINFDWRLEQVGDALCSVSSEEPSILLNRVLSLGSRQEPSKKQLGAIRDVYTAAGVSRFFLHLHPEHRGPTVLADLSAARYRRHRGWMKFTRGREPVGAAVTDLCVRQIGKQDARAFAVIAGTAFGLLPTSRGALATLAESPGWNLYMSFDGDRPAGTGAIFVDGGIGYLDWAATLPEYRRRGSQSALLSARLRHALDAGCTEVIVMTGEAVPGDFQHSYGNILRAGFSECYCRDNWIPAD